MEFVTSSPCSSQGVYFSNNEYWYRKIENSATGQLQWLRIISMWNFQCFNIFTNWQIYLKNILFTKTKGPMNSVLFVTPFSKDWDITFLNIKLGFNKHTKVTEPIFLWKFLAMSKKEPIRRFGPKIIFLDFFFKVVLQIFLKLDVLC